MKIFILVPVFLLVILVVLVMFVRLPLNERSDFSHGENLARMHCAACHSFTEPSILPERSWRFLLPYMSFRMGVDDISTLEGAGPRVLKHIESRRKLTRQIGVAPEEPMLTEKEWVAIRDYYLSVAPDSPLPQPEKPEPEMGLDLFQPLSHDFNHRQAITSLLHVDERNQEIITGDSRFEWLITLNKHLGRQFYANTEGFIWLQAEQKGEGMYFLSIGDLMGGYANDRLGKINYAVRSGDGYRNVGIALTGLHRPSAMAFGDFDRDGTEEVVVTNFGSSTGNVSIYKAEANGWQFDLNPSITLSTLPGAVDCEVADFNEDGLPDVAVLFSDARESLTIFLNRGEGEFERRVIFEKHAAWGFVRFEWIDFDSDGDLDVITVNGDNLDSDPYNTLKPYHGIRLYLNHGNLAFEESFSYPMYGAYGVAAEDFDLDGDVDIAAIAFNPDFSSKDREDFVYLENNGESGFAPKRIEFPRTDRWMTIASGDMDGDGDKDLLLGGGYLSACLDVDYPVLMDEMEAHGRTLFVLENKTK